MVIPWLGYPLSNLLKQCSPNSRAKFIQFETVYRPEQMPGQNIPTLNWPYKGAVTINEAFHPLSLLCLGCTSKINFQIKMVHQLRVIFLGNMDLRVPNQLSR